MAITGETKGGAIRSFWGFSRALEYAPGREMKGETFENEKWNKSAKLIDSVRRGVVAQLGCTATTNNCLEPKWPSKSRRGEWSRSQRRRALVFAPSVSQTAARGPQ